MKPVVTVLLICSAIHCGAYAQEVDTLQQRVDELKKQLEAAELALEDAATDVPLTDDQIFFDDEVFPLLEEVCFKCHSQEKEKGALRLDSLAAVMKGGENGAILTPGDPSGSRIIQALDHSGELKMPPKKQLPQYDIDVLTQWVKTGAVWGGTPENTLPTKPVRAKDVPLATLALDAGEPVSFNQDIRPILSNHCYACHGPDEKARKAGLRLDFEADATTALKSGRAAVISGNLAESQLFNRIAAIDPDDKMPPSDFHKQLSQEQIELLGRWILQGADWERHWAFIPPKKIPSPEISNPSWANNPIDHFIHARLDEERMTPNGEAEKHTLIRRVAFDLTGLPPTPGEVEKFSRDRSRRAYEKMVDRFLESPRYGEHTARYWLDAARYADTNGYHIDNERYMWRWRDWVIDAFNTNKPFDEFTVEQLAGDLLPDPTLDQKIATGFNRNHMINFEGGAIPEEYQLQYVVDRINTTSTIWMALTTNCAQCHDHKYDPITQKEFYQMSAFFNTITEKGLDGNDGNANPMMDAPLPGTEAKLAKAKSELELATEALFKPVSKLDRKFERWLDEWTETWGDRWEELRPSEMNAANETELKTQDDLSVLACGPNPDKETITLRFSPTGDKLTAFRLEALLDESMADDRPGRSEAGNFILSEFAVSLVEADGTKTPLKFARAFADMDQEGLEVAKAIDGIEDSGGWSARGHEVPGSRTAIFVLEKPARLAEGSGVEVKLIHNSKYEQRVMGRFRISSTDADEYALVSKPDWFASGPYRTDNKVDLSANRFLPEKKVDLDAVKEGSLAQWRKLNFTKGKIDLPGEPGVTYIYNEFIAPTERTFKLKLGAEFAMDVFLNGKSIFTSDDALKLRRDRVSVPIPFEQGKNRLLVKVLAPKKKSHFFYELEEEELGGMPFEVMVPLGKDPEMRTEKESKRLKEFYRSTHWDKWESLKKEKEDFETNVAVIEEAIPSVMIMAEQSEKMRDTFVLERGAYDKPGEKVSALTPAVLTGLPEGAPNNRLGFAQWLVSDDHPLTARVSVNRFWQRYFGTGLVKSAEDFGSQGEWPSHPELLDWLAVEFVESGWDVKALQKRILMSATYRQSSMASPEKVARDVENRLLARGARFRLEAEQIRDNALAISGLLVEKIGGPSVRPYQPPGLWKEVAYGGTFSAQTFEQDKGENLYRRSMYTFWKRTAPPPSMMVFDAPNRETCSVRRTRSNTPLQALTLMNDPQFMEASRVFAERILNEGGPTVEDRINFAYRWATSRNANPVELDIVRDILNAELLEYRRNLSSAELLVEVGDSTPDPDLHPEELAAWSVVANLVLNLDETITRN
jgi:hypothetical protein